MKLPGRALARVGIGFACALALAAGFARCGLHEPVGDPVLAVMEMLTLLSAWFGTPSGRSRRRHDCSSEWCARCARGTTAAGRKGLM